MNELRHEQGEKRMGYSVMCEYLVYLKGEHSFLREAHKIGGQSKYLYRAVDKEATPSTSY